MNRGPAIIVVFLTLAFGVFAFAYFLPKRIAQNAKHLDLKSYDEKATASQPEKLSPELLDYIKEERLAANSESDRLDYDSLLKRFEEFEREQNAPKRLADEENADDPIASRFGKYAVSEEDVPPAEFFMVPEGLKNIVNFWVHIFGVYDKNQMIFYNQDDVGIVYSVLDFSELNKMNPGSSDAIQNQMVRQEAQRISQLLEKMSLLLQNPNTDPNLLPDEERRLFGLLKESGDHIPTDVSGLKNSLAYRNGFAHRMREAVALSGQFMPHMQRIFEERGLPTELTVIPFVESSFNLNAYSSAAAAGIWQFIPATGKNYLRIDDVVDERFDPILATYAAASHLAKEYKLFRNWALTINGYNTGPGRVLQAIRQLQTDRIEHIVKYFKGSGYGFDSRNYYPEFLAALEVYRNRTKYFGDIQEYPVHTYDYVRVPADTNLPQLFRVAGLDETLMRQLNAAIKPDVLAGQRNLPKGYLIKIPPETREDVLYALGDMEEQNKEYASYHVMEKGEDLQEIAKRYGLTKEDLIYENDLLPGMKPRAGTILKLPVPEDDSDYSSVFPEE